jgi:hypothetical protein
MTNLSLVFPQDATQMDLKRSTSGFSDWIYEDQGRTPSRAVVNTVMNLRCSMKIGEFHDWLSNPHILKNGTAQWS